MISKEKNPCIIKSKSKVFTCQVTKFLKFFDVMDKYKAKISGNPYVCRG